MPYSSEDDLLLGDLMVSDSVDKAKFVANAADEMDSKIGFIYKTPIVLDSLPRHEQLLLKGINNNLATGRLIMTLDAAGEGTSLHAYGLRLVTEAMGDLLLIANGDVDLSAEKEDVPTQNRDSQPNLGNRDATSAVSAFEDRFMRRDHCLPDVLTGVGWQPGD